MADPPSFVLQFQAFVFEYARHNPDQQHAIRTVLETVIQSELNCSVQVAQQTPSRTQVPHKPKPQRSADRPAKDRNKSSDLRHGGSGSTLATRQSQPASSGGAEENDQTRKALTRVKAGAISHSSPAAIEKTPSTCPANQVSADGPSAASSNRRRKKRKTDLHAGTSPKPQEAPHISPTTKPGGSTKCAQPHAPGDGTMELSAMPPDLVAKVNLVGSIEVLRDVNHTLSRLRSQSNQFSLAANHEASTPSTIGSHETLKSLKAAQILLVLRNELEITEVGEQLYRFRKRYALSQFFDLYEFAQQKPALFLQEAPHTTQGSSRLLPLKQAPRLGSRVLNRFADLMFPNTARTNETTGATNRNPRQIYEEGQRAAAVQKIQDWRRNGKPWSAMIKRFGRGILLLLPQSLSDENLRTMKMATFENLLNTMESILSTSTVLLRSASALSDSLIRGQAPTQILRLETDDTLLDMDGEYDRQDLDALLEPIFPVAPLENPNTRAPQNQKSSDSLALDSSRSQSRSLQIPISQQISPRTLTSPGTPTASFPRWISSVNSGLSPVHSHLNSPARLPTSAVFNDHWLTADLRTPGMASPVW